MTKFSLVHLCAAWFAISGFAYAETGVPAEIKIQGTVCTTGAEKFGEIGCDTLKKESEKFLKDAAKHVIASYRDDGVILQFSSRNGFCKTVNPDRSRVVVKRPFCNLMDGEQGASRCGAYCQFDKNGLVGGSANCKAENSYFLGSRVEIWKKAHEEVAADLENGTIKVHSIDGARPCGAYAKAIITVLDGDKESVPPKTGLRDVRTALSKKYAPTESRINSSELSKACLGDQGEMMDHTKIGDKTRMTRHRSLAFCHLVSAHVRMRGLFHDLLRCEFSTRADEKFLDLANQAFIMDPAMTLADRCKNGSANDHYSSGTTTDADGNSHFWEKFDIDGAVSKFKRCYEGRIDEVVRTAVGSNIPVVTRDALKPYRKIAGKGGSPLEYPDCSGASLSALMLAPFFKRRKGGRSRARAVAKILILMLAFVLMTGFGRKRMDKKAGRDTIDIKVCGDGQTQVDVDYAQVDGVPADDGYTSECGALYDRYYNGCAHRFFAWFCGRGKYWKLYQACINGDIGMAIINTRMGEACPCGGGGYRSECDAKAETPPPSNVLSSPTFADLQNTGALAMDSDVVMPTQKPDSEGDSAGAPSESAATEGESFDGGGDAGGVLADAGGEMKEPTFDMANTTGEGAEGAADAPDGGESGIQDDAGEDGKESALTMGAKTNEKLAYEEAGKGGGKQGSPFQGSRAGSDSDFSGRGVIGMGLSRDPAGASAGGGAGEEDPETYLARAGTSSLFDRVHPHFSRWGDQVQSGKWQSEFKRLGK